MVSPLIIVICLLGHHLLERLIFFSMFQEKITVPFHTFIQFTCSYAMLFPFYCLFVYRWCLAWTCWMWKIFYALLYFCIGHILAYGRRFVLINEENTWYFIFLHLFSCCTWLLNPLWFLFYCFIKLNYPLKCLKSNFCLV